MSEWKGHTKHKQLIPQTDSFKKDEEEEKKKKDKTERRHKHC